MTDLPGIPDVPTSPPGSISAERMHLPDEMSLQFEGFGLEAFELLEGLRQHPHIDQYRKEKTAIRAHIQQPFKRFRDDLVVNWVLPNQIDLETEKNVFSRLLKNDFGAGGCHHHMWMSFYRTGRRRLGDIQLAHSLWPDAFYVVVYLGQPARSLFKMAHQRILREPGQFLDTVNPLLETEAVTFIHQYGTGLNRDARKDTRPLAGLPHDFDGAKHIAFRTAVSRDRVIELGPDLVPAALENVITLWPIYRYLLESTSTES